MSNPGFDRSLGTSKKEQGILTPPAPDRKKCGCLFRGTELLSMCTTHVQAIKKIVQELEKHQQQKDTPKSTPWVESTKATEAVQIGIVTPEQ